MRRLHTIATLLLVVGMLFAGCKGQKSESALPSAEADATSDVPTSAAPTQLAAQVAESPALAATVQQSQSAAGAESKPTPAASEGGAGLATVGTGSSGRLGYKDTYVTAPEVADQAAVLGYDPARLFAFVRDEVAFESYAGILRGALGTLWGRAGNAADQAVLLYALLRESGVEARFARGRLATADAQTLLGTMFTPAVESGLDDVPSSGTVADPVNDAGLLAETSDHLWIQMLTAEGWLDLDPSFPGLAQGDRRVDPSATFDQPPEELYHRLGIRVRLERIQDEGLKTSYPLDYEGHVADMAGRKLSFGHVLEQLTGPQGVEAVSIGSVIGAQQRRYKPALTVAGRAVLGEAFTEAEGLEFTLTSPYGSREVFERAVFDRLGPSARQSGNLDLLRRISMNDLLLGTYLSLLIAPGRVPTVVAQAEAARLQPLMVEHENLERRLTVIREDGAEGQTRQFVIDSLLPYDFRLWMELAHQVNVMMASSSDEAMSGVAQLLGVRRYYDSPRILITELRSLSDGTGAFSLDLRSDSIRALAYPGQNKGAELAFGTVRGVFEASLEGRVLEAVTGKAALTTAIVFAAAEAQGIKPVILGPEDGASVANLSVTKDAKARIAETLDAGYGVVVPERVVSLPEFGGEARVAWWRVDQNTGEVVGVLDSGLHQSLSFYENVILNMYTAQWGNAFGGKDVSTVPVDILVGADAILWKYASEVLGNIDHVKPWEEVHAKACSETLGSIAQTATEIAIATRKPDAVATFLVGAYMGVVMVCP